MKKLLLLLLATLPIQLTAQVNPRKGYIITNDNDTVHGTIDYLTDAFDLYQSIKSQKIMIEGFLTRNAEMYGFMIGHHKLPNRGKDKILNFITLIGSL